MQSVPDLRLIGASLLLVLAQTAAAADLELDKATSSRLVRLPPGTDLSMAGFPVGGGGNATIRLRRADVYARDAHIYAITAKGKQEIPHSDRIFLRGYSDDGKSRVALSLNPDGSFAEGNGIGPDGSFALHASRDATGRRWLSAQSLESTLPTPQAFQASCGNEQLSINAPAVTPDLGTQLHLAVGGKGRAPQMTQGYTQATIAIDTDSLFMLRLFANNVTSATNWIASMFNTMNIMYETDLNVQLLIGTTFLRTVSSTDPYTGLGQNTPSNTADLNLFGGYWRNNESSVPRSFAALLSGAISSTSNSCSAAGIAWVDQYCQKGYGSGGTTYGSYSVNKVCTSINIDPNGAFNARIVGHELGHNFGADHTHCTNINNGSSPASTNTIDQCYNQESGNGCYAGATSCPASGPGAPAGTIMSYCNIKGCGSGQNVLQFHPTQIDDVLLPRIAANTPGCLVGNDTIFRNGFEP